ncbi:MAG TPA: ABC transporter permease [Bryobacteraceae bacterium]
METLWQDTRYAIRTMRKSPGFTAVAVLLLALGIGANTAVFSVVRAVLLRPLPYPDADRLVRLVRDLTVPDASIPEFRFWKEHSDAYESIAAHSEGVTNRGLDTGTSFEWIKVTEVSQDFLKTLGLTAALGREFDAEETRLGGAHAILLSDGLWRRIFGAQPDVLGRSVKIGDANYTIAGILPRNFWFSASTGAPTPDALLPMQPAGTISDNGINTAVIARLKPGVSVKQAEAERGPLAESFLQARGTQVRGKYRGLLPVSYSAFLQGDARPNLLLLTGAAGLLLLIACSNLAGLLLARSAARGKEIAMRLALGSSSRRLVRQSLVENILLSAAGGLAGLAVGSWLLEGLLALAPESLWKAGAATAGSVALDRPVLWFTFAVAMATALLFSITPLAASWRIDISETLKSGAWAVMGGGAIRKNLRSALVVGQVALTVTLLVSAALLIQTMYRLHQQELGFSPQGVMTFWTPPSPSRQKDAAAQQRFEEELLEHLKALPGVSSVAEVNALPLAGYNNFPTEHDGHPEQTQSDMEIRRVTPEYFAIMGIHVLRGRSFDAADRSGAAPVILVNETLARKWWAEGNPLGDRIAVGRLNGKDFPGVRAEEPIREVVGVVADTRRRDVKEPPRPTVYIPAEQAAGLGPSGMNWVLRGNFASGFGETLRQTVASVDPRQMVDRIRTMDEIVTSSTAASRFYAWLFGTFAGVALLLTAAGVYGLLAFSVARRSHEIGTRMALGASQAGVIHLIIREGLALVTIGLAVGLGGAVAVARSLAGLLFNVKPADPFSYFAVAAVLLSVGLLASYLPARRAANVDPMVALRSE